MVNPKNISSLINRLKSGDQKAFPELYDNYSSALYGVILKILGSEEHSQDVLQDTFVKIWKKIHSYDESKGSFYTWMLNIARNTAIDKYRKLKKEGVKLEIQDSHLNVTLGEKATNAIRVDEIGVKELVEKLSPELYQMIDYVYFKGYTHQEVSEELELPLGTVKTRIRSAVKKLRNVFSLILFWI